MRISDWSSDVCSSDLLMKIAAQRELRRGEQVTPPDGLYEEFCARFPSDATDDQARAIEETLEDLGSGRSEARCVVKECVSTCRSPWFRYHYKHKLDG